MPESLPTMSLTRQETDRGTNITVRFPDKTPVSYFSFASLMTSPKLGAASSEFDRVLAAAAASLVERNQAGYHGKVLDTEKAIFISTVKRPFINLVTATQQARRDHIARSARTLDFNKQAEPNALLRHDLRNWLLSHNASVRITILLKSDYAMAVSALEIGQTVFGLDDAQWALFLDHARALIHVHKTGVESDFPKKPSSKMISAAGIDHSAVMEFARTAVKQITEEAELLETAESYLQAVVKFIPLVGDTDVQTILNYPGK